MRFSTSPADIVNSTVSKSAFVRTPASAIRFKAFTIQLNACRSVIASFSRSRRTTKASDFEVRGRPAASHLPLRVAPGSMACSKQNEPMQAGSLKIPQFQWKFGDFPIKEFHPAMFERPTKNDLDTALSMLMHQSRHKLMDAANRLKSDAIENNALQSNGVVVSAIRAADDIHKAAMEDANVMLLDFIERMQRAPSEIVRWARPHLENLNNSVLAVVPPNNFPQDHHRLTLHYQAVFKQRLDIMLRNVEIGHQRGAGFARAEKMENPEEWITAAEADKLLAAGSKSSLVARMALCKRAYAGMVRARAQRFIVASRPSDAVEVPAIFWWAEGNPALEQNWQTGDFDTYVPRHLLTGEWRKFSGELHLQAFGVTFLRSDVEKIAPPPAASPPAIAAEPEVARNKGGRPKHQFWEELLIEMARKLYVESFHPKTQADIEKAMHDWIILNGYEAGETAVRERARMLWRAIEKDDD